MTNIISTAASATAKTIGPFAKDVAVEATKAAAQATGAIVATAAVYGALALAVYGGHAAYSTVAGWFTSNDNEEDDTKKTTAEREKLVVEELDADEKAIRSSSSAQIALVRAEAELRIKQLEADEAAGRVARMQQRAQDFGQYGQFAARRSPAERAEAELAAAE